MFHVKKLFTVLLALAVFLVSLPAARLGVRAAEPVSRTVMLYLIGADLESDYGFATFNLTESMKADYNGHLQFVVMTGGSVEWHTDGEYLSGAEEINPDLNQIWTLSGKKENEEHGVMTLVEPDGLPGFEDTDMADPAALSAFIDYCYDNYSADQYDLILWDHGGGPSDGFGFDDRYWSMMTFSNVIEAIQSNKLIDSGSKFEIIDFDACLMGSVEIVTALSLYADYLVVSAETEPGAGQNYRSWLNALANNPSMSGFDIGRSMVDGLVDYYTNTEVDDATLAVIDTANFLDRMLPALAELDGILISEATEKGTANGRYNFYDELYSLNYSIGYALGEYSLYDLGNLAGALSVPQTEFDVLTDDGIRGSQNVYTDAALRILEVLADNDNSGDDVIYSGYTAWMRKKLNSVTVRGLDRELIQADSSDMITVYPTGLSIFFGDSNETNTLAFVTEVAAAADLLPDGIQKDYLERRIAAPALYALIHEFGSYISDRACEEEYGLDYSEIKTRLNVKKWEWYKLQMIIDSLVSCGEFDSSSDVENYLAEIVAQQSGEVLHMDNISVKKREPYFDSGDTYKVTIDNISAHNIASVGSSMDVYISMEIPELAGLVAKVYDDIPMSDLYPEGIHFVTGEVNGKADMTEFVDYQLDVQYDLMRDFYASDRISWIVPLAERKCYTIVDANGNAHLANITFTDDAGESGYIVILVKTDETTYKYGYLLVAKEDGQMKIKGLTLDREDMSERSFIPMDSDRFKDCSFAPAVFVYDELYYVPVALPVSTFTGTVTDQPNWGIHIEEMPTDQVADVVKVGDAFHIDDIYRTGEHNDVTEFFKEADEKAELGDVVRSIASAEIEVGKVVYSGEFQKPAVTVVYDGKTLAEDTDYVVWFDGLAEPGPAMLMVAGIGDYFGTPASLYTVSCAEHSLMELSVTQPTCTEAGSRELMCTVCYEIVHDPIPANGHNLTRHVAVPATKEKDGTREYWSCETCEKLFLDPEGKRETDASGITANYFEYVHNPEENPVAMKDIVRDETAIYGFRPSETGSLKQYASADWSDPSIVEPGRQERIAYHESIESLYEILRQMQSEGKTVEEIARAVSSRRNELRLEAYKDNPEGLEMLKQRNLEKYGHEEGPLPDELYTQYGSWEKVIEKAFSANVGMDACLGLYDDYYDLYVALGQVGGGQSGGSVNPPTGDGGARFIAVAVVLAAGALASMILRKKRAE